MSSHLSSLFQFRFISWNLLQISVQLICIFKHLISEYVFPWLDCLDKIHMWAFALYIKSKTGYVVKTAQKKLHSAPLKDNYPR